MKTQKQQRLTTIESLEKQAPKSVMKADLVPFETRKAVIESIIDSNSQNDNLFKDSIEEESFRFTGEDGMNMVVNNSDRELKRYDSDVSIEIADYAAISEIAKKNLKQLETSRKTKASKASKDLLNLENLDPVVSKLLQGKNAEEIKVEHDGNFTLNLMTKTDTNQLMLRAEALAKLFIIYHKDEYQGIMDKTSVKAEM